MKDDDFARFEQISSARPFGEPVSTGSFNYTPNHPHSKGGEYDFQAYYHRMLEGYIHRVDSPESADLMYVPHFERRLLVPPKGCRGCIEAHSFTCGMVHEEISSAQVLFRLWKCLFMPTFKTPRVLSIQNMASSRLGRTTQSYGMGTSFESFRN